MSASIEIILACLVLFGIMTLMGLCFYANWQATKAWRAYAKMDMQSVFKSIIPTHAYRYENSYQQEWDEAKRYEAALAAQKLAKNFTKHSS